MSRVEAKHHLWNLHRWYPSAFYGTIEELIIVEGIKKALWLIQMGWPHVVALNGKYMTQKQSDLLSRLKIQRRVILTDGDDAGRSAAREIARKLAGQGELSIPRYPEGITQPDDPRLRVEDMTAMLSQRGGLFEWNEAE
jgi:DNA primase